MADTSLIIRAKLKGEEELRKARNRLLQIGAAAKSAEKNIALLARGNRDLLKSINRTDGRWKKHFDDLDGIIKKFGSLTMGGLKLAIKAAGAEMVLMAASMVALHGLFLAGQGLMKVYTGALNMIAGAASAAGVALASVAAAMREQQAAMFAFRGNAMGMDRFGTSMNKVRVVMRGLHTDSNLAAAGIENLNAAYSAVSQNSTFTRGSQTMLKSLMDFASAGQDVKKGVSSAGSLIGTIQDPKKSWGDIRAAAEAMGPQMKKAMQEAMKAGIDTRAELVAAINSGELAVLGGVEGQWEAVSGTIMSVFKSAFTTIRNDFADMGQQFLKPIKEALDESVNTFRSGMLRVWGPLVQFGQGPFIDSIVGMTEKLTDAFVSLVRRGPEVEGIFGRISDRWTGFVDGWNKVLERLRPLLDGARILETMFGNIFGAIGTYMAESFGTFNQMIQDNQPHVEKFGDRLGELFAAFGRFQNQLKELFMEALPFVNKVLSGVRQIVDMLTSVMKFMGGMMGGLGDGAGAMGLLTGAMLILSRLRAWAGGFLFQKSTGTMNVNAGSVVVTGATAGGQMNPGGMPPVYPGSNGQGGGGLLGPNGQPIGGMRSSNISRFTPLSQSQRSAYEARANRMMTRSQQVGSAKRAMYGQAGPGAGGWRGFMNRAPGGPSLWNRTGGYRLRGMREGTSGMRQRFNSSMGARMGIGMGLGMLSSHAPQEIQGALSMGGMAAMINPLVGLGIAGIGTAMKSENAAHAGIGGAVGGAALGFQAGGPWGAAAGAIVGGVYGLLSAGIRREARKRKYAREAGDAAATAVMDAVFDGLGLQAAARGGVAAVLPANMRSALDAGSKYASANEAARLWGLDTKGYAGRGGTSAQRKASAANRGSQRAFIENLMATQGPMSGDFDLQKVLDEGKYGNFLASYANNLGDEVRAMEFTIDTGEMRLNRLAGSMGLTNTAVLDMAQATGTNLYDATKSYGDLAKSVAEGLMHSVNDLQNAAGDRAGGRASMFQTEVDRLGAPAIIDEIQTGLRDMLASGDWDEATAMEEFGRLEGGYISLAGGDTMLAEQMMAGALGFGGDAWRTGGSMGPELLAKLRESDMFRNWQSGEDGIGTTGATQAGNTREALLANLMSAGFTGMEAQGGKSLSDQLMHRLGPDASYEQLLAIQNSGLLDQANYYGEDGKRKSTSDISAMFTNAGLTNLFTQHTSDNAPHQVMKDSTDKFSDAVDRFITKIDEVFNQDTDTATPRRRMVGMRGLLAKRSSMFRAAGSSSDHLAGAANDYYGSGLGAIQSQITAAGGFAERHGRGPSRHLHAVEGGGGGEGSTSNYTINVTGGASASPAEIADEVMYRIQRQQANFTERR